MGFRHCLSHGVPLSCVSGCDTTQAPDSLWRCKGSFYHVLIIFRPSGNHWLQVLCVLSLSLLLGACLPLSHQGAVCLASLRLLFLSHARVAADPAALWRLIDIQPFSSLGSEGERIGHGGMRFHPPFTGKDAEKHDYFMKRFFSRWQFPSLPSCKSPNKYGFVGKLVWITRVWRPKWDQMEHGVFLCKSDYFLTM